MPNVLIEKAGCKILEAVLLHISTFSREKNRKKLVAINIHDCQKHILYIKGFYILYYHLYTLYI